MEKFPRNSRFLLLVVVDGVLTNVAKASAPYTGQNRQNREKRVSGFKKLPFPSVPEMGALSQKIPISRSTGLQGIFSLKAPISGALGNGSFLIPKLANPFPPPLTAFKNARNPKFVRNLSQRLFLGVPVRGTEIWKNLSKFVQKLPFFKF